MENSEACDHNRIKSTLFPLDIKDPYEPIIDDPPTTKPYKPVIFTNQIHYGGKSSFTPVATPLKGNTFFGTESVIKSPFSQSLLAKDFKAHIGSPSYEITLKDKSSHFTEFKPIFESTVKPNHKSSLETFSPDIIKDLTSKKGSKKAANGLAHINKTSNKNTADPLSITTNIGNPVLPITKVGCNCKNSQCLKLYCECFRNQITCKNCFNRTSNNTRKNAILLIKSKNPTAFEPKFKTTKIVANDNQTESKPNKMAIIISRGCRCQNSNCRKKYCECYQYGLACSDKCRCSSCENGKIDTNTAERRNNYPEHDDVELNKRSDFDVKAELKKKLLEIKKFKLENCSFN